MDFGGDGLPNIVKYYGKLSSRIISAHGSYSALLCFQSGLHRGDMYADIAHGGHPHVAASDWPYQFPLSATDPYTVDTDGDLLTDAHKLLYGMDPRKHNDIHADTDGVGLSPFRE
jgi:hypothetical protein